MDQPWVASALRLHTEAMAVRGSRWVWITSASGYKTRNFDDILTEIKGFFAVHEREGTVPGGVHLELTHEAVTECLGGSEEVLDTNLAEAYQAVSA